MAKKKEAQGFEVTEYSGEENIYERFSTIKQIVSDKVREQPNIGCHVVLTGHNIRVVYHAYEMHAPVRMAEIEHAAKSYLDEVARHIKKEFKSRTGKVLDLKEDKSLANGSIEKVSLNERYHVSRWRIYEMVV